MRWAIESATRQQGTVRAVTVRRPNEVMPATSYALEPHGLRVPERDGATGRRHLAELVDRAKTGIDQPAEVVAISTVGDPETELANAAADADLLVVGGHGQGPVAEVFLGSVAAGAVRHAPCPVVVIPHQLAERFPHPV